SEEVQLLGGWLLGWLGLSRRTKSVYQCVGCILQNNSPRAQDRCRDEKDEYEDRDWLWSNPKPKPDDVGLMNEIEAVGINTDETDDFGETGSARDQSRDTDDCKKTARARSEIAEDVGDAVVIEFQRERIQ